jgi:signal peptidase I
VVSTTPIVEAAKQDLARFYRGQSMAGTFRPGDALIVADVSIDSVHRGDVVLFRSMDADGEPEQVVHRVVAVLPEGLVTRGDNNRRVDLGLVTPDRLVGLVTHLERAGKRRRVRGSWWGLLHIRRIYVWRRIRWRGRRLAASVGGILYRRLRDSGFTPRLWQPPITRVCLTTSGGLVVKYVCGKRTVARWWPETGQFQCRKPYDLIISRPHEHEFLV